MKYLYYEKSEKLAVVTLARGKVNAIDREVIDEFSELFSRLSREPDIRSAIITGQGKFFSFGFDVPLLYDYSPQDFTQFLRAFCRMYREIFLFPKPLVAAINGHAVAGGCILALMADYRIMTESNGKMALNEVTFGAALFAGAVEMLRYAVGNKNAAELLLSGKMFTPQEAQNLGLVDYLVPEPELAAAAQRKAEEMGRYYGPNYAALKGLLRYPIVEEWSRREEDSIQKFVEIWYSPETRAKTREIKIF
ncbi:MAG: enoyl-CoA hydratase/isomerase family protein [Candidatus Zixiibacteriota bacterium]